MMYLIKDLKKYVVGNPVVCLYLIHHNPGLCGFQLLRSQQLTLPATCSTVFYDF